MDSFKEVETAITSGNALEVEHLVSKFQNVDISGPQGESALMIAAQLGNVSCINKLLALGANPSWKDNGGETALMWVVNILPKKAENQLACLKALIFAGADVSSSSGCGDSALMLAVEGADLHIVQALLAAGAEVNKWDKFGQTALIRAVGNGKPDVVQYVQVLLDAGSDIEHMDQHGNTPLMGAIESGSVDIMLELLLRGARTDEKNAKNESVLDLASHTGTDANGSNRCMGVLSPFVTLKQLCSFKIRQHLDSVDVQRADDEEWGSLLPTTLIDDVNDVTLEEPITFN